MTKWPSDLYPKKHVNTFILNALRNQKRSFFEWPFISQKVTFHPKTKKFGIAHKYFEHRSHLIFHFTMSKFSIQKHTHFLGFDIPISFRTHSDIIPKARNHQKLTIIWGQKRTTFSPSVFAFISAPHPLSQKNRKFAPTNINNWSFWFRRGRAESPTSA